jgi:hypothetical protein
LGGAYLFEKVKFGVYAADKFLRVSSLLGLFYLLSQKLSLVKLLLLGHVLILHYAVDLLQVSVFLVRSRWLFVLPEVLQVILVVERLLLPLDYLRNTAPLEAC